ncbi:hypothetical protein Hypma_005671 [Hypsizygus marmoreus]|uniref:Integrase core domain-containing protein n=1 Tax=Hypsizygus marmoreus TaxID=39966 RepID=A0A369K6Q0_HYPMA|nr:hypothetical protein Hypma_005671 [Hypsizygus marmoreus]
MPGNPLLTGKSTRSNNSEGSNGANNGTWPPEDILEASLLAYAKERLSLQERIQRLRENHGLIVGLTLLKKLNAHFGVPSARKPLPRDMADQLILDKMSEDPNRLRGTGAVMTALSLDGHNVPRRIIRETMLNNDPDGVDRRYPGRKKVKRVRLQAQGTWQEVHCDGHEKLGALALRMGGVGLPIYGMRDKWSGAILYLVVVPNDRLADTIGHVYLDFIEMYGVMAQQTTVDKGSETGNMYAIVTGLKETYAPDICLNRYPAFVALTSTNNTPIEGLWHWFQDHYGKNLFLHVTRGKDEGIFNPNNPIHVHLFNWIWPPIIQGELDHFTNWWNMHRIRKQNTKNMPSGSTPNAVFTSPEHYCGRRFSIPIPREATRAMRTTIATSYEDALAWVPPEFDELANLAYKELGSPECSAETAWELFRSMAALVE